MRPSSQYDSQLLYPYVTARQDAISNHYIPLDPDCPPAVLAIIYASVLTDIAMALSEQSEGVSRDVLFAQLQNRVRYAVEVPQVHTPPLLRNKGSIC